MPLIFIEILYMSDMRKIKQYTYGFWRLEGKCNISDASFVFDVRAFLTIPWTYYSFYWFTSSSPAMCYPRLDRVNATFRWKGKAPISWPIAPKQNHSKPKEKLLFFRQLISVFFFHESSFFSNIRNQGINYELCEIKANLRSHALGVCKNRLN